jgi:signal transduction histidine kinase
VSDWGAPLRTLRGRLVVTYAGVALLAVVVSAAVISALQRDVLLDRIAADLVGEAYVLADQVGQPLAEGDTAAVGAYITRIDSLTTAHILVVDRDGDRIVMTDPIPGDLQAERASLAEALAGETVLATDRSAGAQGSLVRVVVPVTGPAGDVVGALRESYNFEDLPDVVWRVNAVAFAGGVGAAILAAMVGFLFANDIARPVRRVAHAALELAEGAPTESIPESRGSTEEVDALVRAFNTLARQLAVHEQARREFASDVSHELHALASAMQTAAAALERGASRGDPSSTRRLVAGLVGHTRRLGRLASDLLELGRWEGGRLRLEMEDLDVADLVQGVLDEWAAEAERRETALQVQVPDGPLPIHGDPVRLAQALGNLLENALKYAGDGGRIRIDVVADRRQGMYGIGVEDSGPGISAEILPRVFERYYRVEGRAGGGPGGMGLGLAIARGIARAHGGDVVAESVPDAGARFVLCVPIPPDDDPAAVRA